MKEGKQKLKSGFLVRFFVVLSDIFIFLNKIQISHDCKIQRTI